MSADLFALDSYEKKQMRAKLSPTLTSGKMKYMFPTVIEMANRYHDCLFEVVHELSFFYRNIEKIFIASGIESKGKNKLSCSRHWDYDWKKYDNIYNPEYYPDPEKFDPDRFDYAIRKERDVMTWLGFGDGPRNCIGLRFGMMQARIGLVTLLHYFKFSMGTKTKIPPHFSPDSFIAVPEGGIYLKVKLATT